MRAILDERIRLWLDDPESSVEYSEEVEGRIAVRMRQDTRDATTVWFEVGERSLSYEAYVMPLPDDAVAALRQGLLRNAKTWRVFFALDGKGGLILRGRMPEDSVNLEELDLVLGEIYELIEVSFRPMLRAAYPKREKSG